MHHHMGENRDCYPCSGAKETRKKWSTKYKPNHQYNLVLTCARATIIFGHHIGHTKDTTPSFTRAQATHLSEIIKFYKSFTTYFLVLMPIRIVPKHSDEPVTKHSIRAWIGRLGFLVMWKLNQRSFRISKSTYLHTTQNDNLVKQ